VTLVALGGLAGLGGALPGTTLPLLAACAGTFAMTRARIAGTREARLLDAGLLAVLAAGVGQTLPMPGGLVSLLSPQAWPLRSMLHVETTGAWWPVSVDARATRDTLALASAAVLLFWAARDAFARGGVRTAARLVAWSGLVVTMTALAQRATAPGLVLWRWAPADPGSQPFGFFVNRNHFATWLLMAGGLTAGYLVAHRRSHRADHASRRLLVRDWLADGNGLILAGALVIMLLGVAASLSRAAILGAGAALVLAGVFASRARERGPALRAGGVAVALILAAAVVANLDGLERKFESATAVSRATIWRETAPVIRDFWLTGTGLGTYSLTMLRYQQTDPALHFNQAHSEYVQLLAEGGLILALPILLAGAAWLRLAGQRFRTDAHEAVWIRVGAAAGLAAAAVQGIFETGLRVPANALLAALLAAIVVHRRGES
jgi:O-antigen ligase